MILVCLSWMSNDVELLLGFAFCFPLPFRGRNSILEMVPETTGDLIQLCQRPWLLVWNFQVSIEYLLTPWLSPKGLLVTRMTDPSGRTRWLLMVNEVPPGVPFRPHPGRHMGFRPRSPEVPVLRPRFFSHRTLGRHITSESSICS